MVGGSIRTLSTRAYIWAFLFIVAVLYQYEGVSFSQRNIYLDNKNIFTEPTFPSYLKKNPTCKVNQVLSEFLISDIEIGWENRTHGAPDWLKVMCPEVVEHFNKFPFFSEYQKFLGLSIPIQTTDYAAQAVCTAKVVKLLATSVQARVYLHAGSHLGALIHGSPIPWDDDVDMFLDFDKKEEFVDLCSHFGGRVPILAYPKRVELHCFGGWNSLKVWLQPEGAKRFIENDRKPWYSPYIDLFFFRIQSGLIREVWPSGKIKGPGVKFKTEDFFPTRPFYFGGIYLIGPRPRISELRGYKKQNCVMSIFNHRLEKDVLMPESPLRQEDLCIDCRKLHRLFPFVYDEGEETIRVSGHSRGQTLYPVVGTTFHPLVDTTIRQRLDWFSAAPSNAQQITNQLVNLNKAEIDNTIAQVGEFGGRLLNVVEFNAGRGKHWLESSELLKDADVIILNEMDIGMARSDQQHTARLMAYHLGMNYAWGLEFVELTLGDEGDRKNIDPNEQNTHGLHGNAILSKFAISNVTIFRYNVGSYFSDKPNRVNAGGLERRLGGRMIMLGRIMVNGVAIVIGSTHKLRGFRAEIRDYIGKFPAIIAGDQEPQLCRDVGLNEIKSRENHPTWPASCESMGVYRGDNICSNMKVAVDEYTIEPCVRRHGLNVSLGDHALTGAIFEVNG
mmetsp:Transcript_20341/g.32021  ORF Transcript_20341/g.32021 Transcript_20341/m.32021 type:complete len:671 (+) Transcript_20341:283-2295(+)